MTLSVLLCDDQRNDVAAWAEQIQDALGVGTATAMEVDAFRDAVRELEKRRWNLHGAARIDEDWDPHVFDVDVLVLDYDLTLLDDEKYITGESIAYLARCFSRCGLIVAMNQFKAGFDLTLAGHPESFADVNIRSDQIGNPGLWGPTRVGFRPWRWPELELEVDRSEERSRELETRLDDRVLEHLALASLEPTMPRGLLEFLEGDDVPSAMTFRDFVQVSDYGARVDTRLADPIAARIASARIASWFRQVVAEAQEVVIDAPHMAMRVPALMKDADASDWESLTTLDGDITLDSFRALDEARFEGRPWSDRPTWYWARASELATALPSAPLESELVFCEDISRFVPRSAAKPFVAELPTAFRRRFVFDSESDHGARLIEDEQWAFAPIDVDYRPSIRFAM